MQTMRAALLIGCMSFIGVGGIAQTFNARYDLLGLGLPQTAKGLRQVSGDFVVIEASIHLDTIAPDTVVYTWVIGLSRLDAYGALVNDSKLQIPAHGLYAGWANCCDTTEDHGIVIGGTIESYDGVAEVFLVRFNNAGDTLWTRRFGSSGDYWSGRQVKQTSDSGFVIVGDTDASGGVDAFVIKTDSLGNEEWRETYGNGLGESFISVEPLPDGGYVLGGIKELGSSNTDHWIVRVDSLGGIMWQKNWGTAMDDNSAHSFLLADGNIAMASNTGYGPNYHPARPYLAKVNVSDGSIIWDGEYGPAYNSTTFFAVKERPNGDWISCGVTYEDNEQQGLMLRTTANGDSIWMRNFWYYDSLIEYGNGRFYDVLPTDDGGFIAAGATYAQFDAGYPPGYSQDAWVVKVDSMGCIVPGCDGVGVSEIVTNLGNALTVFPNPAHGQVQVQVDLPRTLNNTVDLKLTLVNAAGQVALAQAAQVGSNTVDLGALSAGVYYMHLSSNTTWLSGTKLMVE